MTTVKRVPVLEGLFEDSPEGPRLLASRCRSCGTPSFPRSPLCRDPSCGKSDVEAIALSPRGTLWSYTVQYYQPPSPARFDQPFAPYAIGLVDLPEGIRVMGMISTKEPEALQVGAEMQLVLDPLYHDDEGNEVITWKFRPQAASAGA